MSSYQPSKIYKLITSSNFKGTYKNVFYMNTLGDFDSIHINFDCGKVNSVQEACVKCFAVHVLKGVFSKCSGNCIVVPNFCFLS